MSFHVIVIGGGFAGLRAAVTLADSGAQVTVVEARCALGGRARSFLDPATSEEVDNGPHLFLAAYHETRRFLERLGTQQHLLFQERLRVTFAQPGGRISLLDCPPASAPWHLLLGLARLSNLSLRDKINMWKVFRAVSDGESLDEETVEGWLTRLGQSPRSRVHFWYPVAIATLNENPSKASALGFSMVLRTLFTSAWPSARLGMASLGLSDLYTGAARKIVENRGGRVMVNCPVSRLVIEDSRMQAVRLANGTTLSADAVVSAVPPSVLARIVPAALKSSDPVFSNLERFTTSPIVSINLWLDRPVTQELFVGLIGTRIQWFFNKKALLARAGIKANYVSVLISAAHSFIDQSSDGLVAMALEEMRACFPKARGARLIRSQVIREREATVSLTVGMERFRPGPVTGVRDLFLAGDWTDTGLPATIESAVVSGQRCAQAVKQRLEQEAVNV